ncbi:MAG: NUDIX hydrolase [Paracoccus sp. (in: a-proteobacteria)]|uniref:NUDIX hydrolase n=1 Tax=Paracoccus sp. TaxID=267 RepID=UPI0026DF1597|nr:NUDIX hydrolase [Paracoccus sp. (in: a-proteobacteria)]MDO5613244.1 NUDIX hydrolase [Paracoccus sp. (in: a-proteobacteria)]
MTEAPAPTGRFVGAKLLLTCGDSILVMQRDDLPGLPWAGMWDLPGGGAEPGETPPECALRELAEETGLHLGQDRITRAEPRPSISKPGRVGWYFVLPITVAEAKAARLGDEGQALRLMPVAEFIAHPQAIPAFRDIVAEMVAVPSA